MDGLHVQGQPNILLCKNVSYVLERVDIVGIENKGIKLNMIYKVPSEYYTLEGQ
jgi:hypothetical protein